MEGSCGQTRVGRQELVMFGRITDVCAIIADVCAIADACGDS